MSAIRRRWRFTGTVQGVGFRYYARAAALHLGLTGWVANNWDGSVTLEAQLREANEEGSGVQTVHCHVKDEKGTLKALTPMWPPEATVESPGPHASAPEIRAQCAQKLGLRQLPLQPAPENKTTQTGRRTASRPIHIEGMMCGHARFIREATVKKALRPRTACSAPRSATRHIAVVSLTHDVADADLKTAGDYTVTGIDASRAD